MVELFKTFHRASATMSTTNDKAVGQPVDSETTEPKSTATLVPTPNNQSSQKWVYSTTSLTYSPMWTKYNSINQHSMLVSCETNSSKMFSLADNSSLWCWYSFFNVSTFFSNKPFFAFKATSCLSCFFFTLAISTFASLIFSFRVVRTIFSLPTLAWVTSLLYFACIWSWLSFLRLYLLSNSAKRDSISAHLCFSSSAWD